MDEHTSAEHREAHRLDDCWNRIGVQGDRSCPALAQHVHCRNCPVYVAAANGLLDRPLPEEDLTLFTERFAAPAIAHVRAHASVFVFRLGGEWLALPTNVLEAVATTRPIRALPHRRSSTLRGVVNIRGELLVCVSLAQVLGIEAETPAASPRASTTYERLLVLRRGSSRFVAHVDEVHGAHRFVPDELVRPPETLARAATRFSSMLLPWSDKMVGCLDEALLFAALEHGIA